MKHFAFHAHPSKGSKHFVDSKYLETSEGLIRSEDPEDKEAAASKGPVDEQMRRMAEVEQRQRFADFQLIIVLACFLMGGGQLLFLSALVGEIAVVLGVGLFFARLWGLKQKKNKLLRILNQVVLVACLVGMVGAALYHGQDKSIALWFLPLLPVMAAFVNTPPTAARWGWLTAVVAIGLWASERYVTTSPSAIAALDLQILTLVTLIFVATAFGFFARRTSDHHLDVFEASLLAEQKAKHAAEHHQLQAEQSQQAADLANQAKSEFLATMSHEIRTPLNGVIGFNSLLRETRLDEQQQQYTELARQSGEILLHLINDFLDFAKIEAGHLELEAVIFDPHQVVSDNLAFVRAIAQQKGLVVLSETNAPNGVRGDRSRLSQILLSLLNNAIKFTKKGSVTLRCHEIASPGSEVWLPFEVVDTGIGIPEDGQQRLFQPFTQADNSTTRVYGGTGLGLAICKSLTEIMGGRLGVVSAPGQGSVFWLEMPFEAVAQEDWPIAEAESLTNPMVQLHTDNRCRILLVEDNPVNQLVASEMLKRLGYHVEVVGNGLEAIEAIRQFPFNLVLIDCDMPVMDGFEASRTIRAEEPPSQHIPIVAMTASALKGDREKCLAAGMDDYLAKPVRLGELRKMMSIWVDSEQDGTGLICRPA
jgi:signal transduction histidine kinase/ActR/RegA family two-component response regulator